MAYGGEYWYDSIIYFLVDCFVFERLTALNTQDNYVSIQRYHVLHYYYY